MSLRIIVRTDNMNHAAHVGAPVVTTYRTFDVDLPEVEEYLRAGGYNEDGSFLVRQVIGAEEIGRS